MIAGVYTLFVARPWDLPRSFRSLGSPFSGCDEPVGLVRTLTAAQPPRLPMPPPPGGHGARREPCGRSPRHRTSLAGGELRAQSGRLRLGADADAVYWGMTKLRVGNPSRAPNPLPPLAHGSSGGACPVADGAPAGLLGPSGYSFLLHCSSGLFLATRSCVLLRPWP